MYHYAFILGRVPELSALEIKEVLTAERIPIQSLSYASKTLYANVSRRLDATMLINRLGGTIKIGEVLDGATLGADMIERYGANTSSRITFGISDYTHSLSRSKIESLGIAIKKELKGRGRSVRFVMPQKGETELSSVVVQKQGLLEENGVELFIFNHGKNRAHARTIAVQPFEEFSKRDWERPAKSMDVGMLPPKIARMMVNCSGIAGSAGTLLDPFCGLGTILQEALLTGITHVEGSDINKHTINAAQKNLFWLSQEKNLSLAHVRLRVCDARNLSQIHKLGSVGAIVTEPYLGPIVRQSGIKNLSAAQKELSGLYRAFLENAHTVLKRGGRIAIVFPVWIRGKEKTFLPVLKTILPPGFAVVQESILIARQNQHVARELFIFEKNS